MTSRNSLDGLVSEYRRVIVLGGGTAGYLTALTCRAFHPEISVTLIESSKIPIIGVGEATTSELVPYLHHLLGLDVQALFREVRPTWKLGIRFEWGCQPTGYFNYPFDAGSVNEALLYDRDLDCVTPTSALMTGDRFPIIDGRCGLQSFLWKWPFAYHLDNKPFVEFLKRQSTHAGVLYADAEIVDAALADDGETITSLIASDGRSFTADLYIDCSGFRSFLIERKLGSSFIDYKSSLFTDTAVVASRPHSGLIRPYTTAETMSHGWCWNIPQVHEDHRGYVFSSSFCTVDAAAAEMRAKNPGMGDYWTVRFRTGRHEHFWKGNVVAIGNSYGFVEPLESTAIQMVMRENLLLWTNLPSTKNDISTRQALNERVGWHWDYIRWFLSIHYKFNTRLQTEFWNTCREQVDTSGADWIIERYRTSAPLFYNALPAALNGPTFNSFGFDVLLSGQGVSAQWLPPRESKDEYERRKGIYLAVARQALPQADALERIREHPEYLDDCVNDSQGWVMRLAHYLRDTAALSYA